MTRFSHRHIQRALQSFGHGDHLLLGLSGDLCPTADCHLLTNASDTGLTTEFTACDTGDPSDMVNKNDFLTSILLLSIGKKFGLIWG